MRRAVAFCLLIGLMMTFLVVGVNAQRQRRPSGGVAIEEIRTRQTASPVFNSHSVQSATPVHQRWFQFTLRYSAEGGIDGWINELVLRWSVILVPERGNPILMKKEVTYLDIDTSVARHYAIMFIRPAFLRRYTDGRFRTGDVAARVEALVDGEVTYVEIFEPRRLPDQWWNMNPPKVRTDDTALLARNETPFAALDYDALEYIKVKDE